MIRAATPLVAALLALCACSPSDGPQTGGQTNWLVRCTSSDECGELECVCGTCSASCEGGNGCAGLPGATCVAASDEAAAALCSGSPAPVDVCLPACDTDCDDGFQCVFGACIPLPVGTARVAVDVAATRETLVGFGASLAYAEDVIVASPDKTALYDLLFGASGLDLLRMGNRYTGASAPDLAAPAEIVAEATARLGHTPLLFMTSASPPAPLKANASTTCAGDPRVCTLTTLPGGGFDYQAFAAFWRATLDGYAAAGIAPDYVSIQNDPDWVPAAEAPHEACRFLPEEGSALVTVAGVEMGVAYPGYREALAAVRAAVVDMPTAPRFAAPEASELGMVGAYAAAMDASAFDALAIHLYDVDPSAPDPAAFSVVRDVAQQLGRPVFQTEMQAGGLETAILVHHAFASAGATAYLQNDLVAWMPEQTPVALALLTADGLEAQEPYYALLHHAQHTDPGWIRVETRSDSSEVLATAWMSPDGSGLTVVLVNAGDEARPAQLAVPAADRDVLSHTALTRTVFGGSERAAPLGALPAGGLVQLPARSILTVTFSAE